MAKQSRNMNQTHKKQHRTNTLKPTCPRQTPEKSSIRDRNEKRKNKERKPQERKTHEARETETKTAETNKDETRTKTAKKKQAIYEKQFGDNRPSVRLSRRMFSRVYNGRADGYLKTTLLISLIIFFFVKTARTCETIQIVWR